MSTPWVDIQSYGSAPHEFAYSQPSAAATTVAGSPNVTLSTSGALYQSLKNGQGVCIWKAGSATGQSTPSAPAATSPAVQGSQTVKYECVGYDSMGGLTAASATGTVTNAPAVFGPLPIPISSITAAGGVVTATFASPLNTSVLAGMTIHVVIPTGPAATWSGIWTIASVISSSEVTFNVSGASGTGTPNVGTGRLSNTQPITAISRAANGVITITTAQPHNYQYQSGMNPTVIVIENCSPDSLNGWYVIASVPTTTTITVNSGVLSTVTGTLTLGSSTCTVWEFITVACPALTGTTIGYYIYSDSPSPGGSLQLIGRCVQGESHFTDWGQSIMAGYGAPGYVPTAPPGSSQNQLFTSTILSGGGTTSIVLNNSVPASIPALGATLLYDDGPNLVAAAAAAGGNTSIGGAVLISPPTSNSDFSGYIFNSPITIHENINVIFGCHCIVNETMTFTAFNQISALFGQNLSTSIQFCQRNYCDIGGLGNPMMSFGENSGNAGGIDIDGLGFTSYANGVCALQLQSVFYCKISNCAFTSNNTTFGNAVGIICNGSDSLCEFADLNWALANRFYGNGVPGQSSWGPPIGAIWFRGSDNPNIPNYNDNSSSIAFTGKHSANGRGILFDQNFSGGNSNQGPITIGHSVWLQQGTTPILMFWGNIFYGVEIHNVLNDTSEAAVVANWATNMYDVYIYNSSVGLGYSVTTGNFIANLFASGNTLQNQTQLQRVAVGQLTSTAAQSDIVSVPNATPGSVITLSPTNASAALDIAAGNAFVSAKGNGTVTVSHSQTSGMTFDIAATVGN